MSVQNNSSTGTIVTIVFVALAIGLAVYFLTPRQRVYIPTPRIEASNNLKMIGLAMHNYSDGHKTLPPPAIYGKDGTPLLSWRVLLLPYIEQQHLYAKFRLDEPWDSSHNKDFLRYMPPIYQHPRDQARMPNTPPVSACSLGAERHSKDPKEFRCRISATGPAIQSWLLKPPKLCHGRSRLHSRMLPKARCQSWVVDFKTDFACCWPTLQSNWCPRR
jgi:hypothetical protein